MLTIMGYFSLVLRHQRFDERMDVADGWYNITFRLKSVSFFSFYCKVEKALPHKYTEWKGNNANHNALLKSLYGRHDWRKSFSFRYCCKSVRVSEILSSYWMRLARSLHDNVNGHSYMLTATALWGLTTNIVTETLSLKKL